MIFPPAQQTDVVIVCGAGYVSGKEVMTLALTRVLRASRRRVYLVCSSWTDGDFGGRLASNAIPYTLLPLGFISASLRMRNLAMTLEQVICWPALVIRYFRLMRLLEPTRVVHTNWHHLALLWPFLRPTRDILWFHEVVPDKWHYKVFFSAIAKRLRNVVAVSRTVRDSLARAGVSPAKLCVIHNGLPTPDVLERLEPRSAITLGIVGQVGPWKGHDDMVEAFGIVAKHEPSVRLAIFGRDDGPFASALKKRIQDLGLGSRVEWAGFERQQRKIYEQIDICIVPSRSSDPLPTSAIEAGFFEVPVIATSQGGLPEIIEDGITGLLVPAKDPNALASAILRLARNPVYARDMGRRARVRMETLFSEERFRHDFLNALYDPQFTDATAQ